MSVPFPFDWQVGLPTRPWSLRDVQALAAVQGLRVPLSDARVIEAHYTPVLGLDKWFNEADNITLAASASRSVVVSYELPAATLGIFRFFGTGVVNAADWDNIRWAIQVGGSPLFGFDNIVGPISDILYPVQIAYPLFKGQLVRVLATNLSATAIEKVSAMVRGTIFPDRLPSPTPTGE